MSDSRLDAKANRILHRNNAQEIVKALADLEEHRAEFATRWLWELIQNARACAWLSFIRDREWVPRAKGQERLTDVSLARLTRHSHHGPSFLDVATGLVS